MSLATSDPWGGAMLRAIVFAVVVSNVGSQQILYSADEPKSSEAPKAESSSSLTEKLKTIELASDFEAGYSDSLLQAEAADWRPSSAENKEWIQRAAGGSAFSRPRGLAKEQLAALSEDFAARAWDFEKQIAPLNDFAIDVVSKGPGRVMFFGKVVHTFQETHVSRVQLLGRGYIIDVFEFVDPKVHRKHGEILLVMGMRPPKLETAIHRVAAGLVVQAKTTALPRDTALTELHDFVRYKIESRDRQKLVIDPARNFPQIKIGSEGEPQLVYKFKMNTTGAGFDAVRIPASTGKPDDDLIWSVTMSSKDIGDWGITSVAGVIKSDDLRGLNLYNYQPANLPLPEQNTTIVAQASGEVLKDSQRHLLWFEFLDREPIDVTLTGVYRPKQLVPRETKPLFETLGLPKPFVLIADRKQQLFSTVKCPDTGDDKPTVQGVPFVPAISK